MCLSLYYSAQLTQNIMLNAYCNCRFVTSFPQLAELLSLRIVETFCVSNVTLMGVGIFFLYLLQSVRILDSYLSILES